MRERERAFLGALDMRSLEFSTDLAQSPSELGRTQRNPLHGRKDTIRRKLFQTYEVSDWACRTFEVFRSEKGCE